MTALPWMPPLPISSVFMVDKMVNNKV